MPIRAGPGSPSLRRRCARQVEDGRDHVRQQTQGPRDLYRSVVGISFEATRRRDDSEKERNRIRINKNDDERQSSYSPQTILIHFKFTEYTDPNLEYVAIPFHNLANLERDKPSSPANNSLAGNLFEEPRQRTKNMHKIALCCKSVYSSLHPFLKQANPILKISKFYSENLDCIALKIGIRFH